jgi:hypothetical protein
MHRETFDHLAAIAYLGSFLPCMMAEDQPKNQKADPGETP